MSVAVESGRAIAVPSPADSRETARVLAEAFVDDPVWASIGPTRRGHRGLANRASFAGIVAACRRHRARVRVARDGERVLGVTIAFLPGTWPMPDRSFLWEIGWLAVAGPLPTWRGLRCDRVVRSHHVTHPHVYLWFLGVDPALHGTGVGSELMAELHAESDRRGLPTYLETGTETNVGFYERLGYSVGGRIELPTGVPIWLMERPAAGNGDPG